VGKERKIKIWAKPSNIRDKESSISSKKFSALFHEENFFTAEIEFGYSEVQPSEPFKPC
jgi:hypothetical protein